MRLQSAANEGGDGGYADDGAARGCLGGHLAGSCLSGIEGAVEVRTHGVGVKIRFNPVMVRQFYPSDDHTTQIGGFTPETRRIDKRPRC